MSTETKTQLLLGTRMTRRQKKTAKMTLLTVRMKRTEYLIQKRS